MAITREQVEDLYGRMPMLRPPPEIYYLSNADISAARLYEAAHAANLQRLDYTIRGMYQTGQPYIVVAGNAAPTTWIHEAVHFNGVQSEVETRVLTQLLYRRARWNLGVLRRPVRYSEAPVAPDQVRHVLAELHLDNPNRGNVELIHLVYVPA